MIQVFIIPTVIKTLVYYSIYLESMSLRRILLLKGETTLYYLLVKIILVILYILHWILFWLIFVYCICI